MAVLSLRRRNNVEMLVTSHKNTIEITSLKFDKHRAINNNEKKKKLKDYRQTYQQTHQLI